MLDDVAIVLRLALCSVFGVAAVLKFLDLASFRRSVEEFGVRSSGLAAVLAIAVPVVEIACAGGLLLSRTAVWAAVGTVCLITIFTAVISVNLSKGRTPSCSCFGQIGAKPIGRATILRNALLAAMAVCIIVVERGRNVPEIIWYARVISINAWLVSGLVLVSTAIVGGMGWLIAKLLRQQGRLLLRLDHLEMRLGNLGLIPGAEAPGKIVGLTPGTLAPAFNARTLGGLSTSLEEIKRTGMPIVLLFSDAACAPCTALLPRLAKWCDEYRHTASIWLVTRGSPSDIEAKILAGGMQGHRDNVLIQTDREIAIAFESNATPSAVIVNSTGLVATYLAVGEKEITTLFSELPAHAGRKPSARRGSKTSREDSLAIASRPA